MAHRYSADSIGVAHINLQPILSASSLVASWIIQASLGGNVRQIGFQIPAATKYILV
jgi:hypothetical protein